MAVNTGLNLPGFRLFAVQLASRSYSKKKRYTRECYVTLKHGEQLLLTKPSKNRLSAKQEIKMENVTFSSHLCPGNYQCVLFCFIPLFIVGIRQCLTYPS